MGVGFVLSPPSGVCVGAGGGVGLSVSLLLLLELLLLLSPVLGCTV